MCCMNNFQIQAVQDCTPSVSGPSWPAVFEQARHHQFQAMTRMLLVLNLVIYI